LLAVAIDWAALVVVVLTPAHAGGWMQDILPSPGAPAEAPVRDLRLLLTGAAVGLAGGLNLYLAIRRRGAWRVGNVGLALALAGFWTFKFLV
jgi:hypothetical protein